MNTAPKGRAPNKTQDPEVRQGERRVEERRKQKSRGYTYISMVGWMDRREELRRSNDTYRF